MKKMRFSVYKVWQFIAFVLVFFVSACAHSGSGEKEAPNPDVTAKIIRADANKAGLYFLATPNTAAYAEATRNAKNAGFIWSVDLVIVEENSSNFVSGRINQLAAAGSGFQFSLKTKNPPHGLRGAIGFNALFTFTADADNLGTATYHALLAALENLEQLEGGWVAPEPAVLTDLGISVYTRYLGQDKDITDRISFAINMAQQDQAGQCHLLF
jgi:hypothetical protein